MPTQNIFNLVDTWASGGGPYTSIKMNATDNDAGSASLLMDLQVGGSSRFNVAKSGTVVAGRPGSANAFYYATAIGSNFTGWAEADANTAKFIVNSTGVSAGMLQVRFASSDYGISVGKSLGIGASDASSSDVWLSRRASASLRLGAADTSSFSTVTLTLATPGNVNWGTHGLTTGTPVIFGTTGALPTGLVSGTTYYAIIVDANNIRVASSFANALAGTAIAFSGSQSGTQYGTRGAIAQQFGPQDVLSTSSLENIDGADFVIRGSRSIGNKPGGSIVFQVAPAGSSGTAQNALVDTIIIAPNGNVTFPRTGAASLRVDGEGYFALASGAIRASFSQFGCRLSSALTLSWSDSGNPASVIDTILARDAANTLALRNGANGQTFRVYNTTDGTNSEFGAIKWNSNVLEIASEIAGTGTRRPIAMVGGIGPYTLLKSTDYGTYLRQISSSSGLNLYNNDANAQAAQSTGRVAYLEGGTGICLSSSFEIKFSSGADAASSHDSGIARSAAGVLRLTNASTGGGALQLTEMTAPAAPATNNVRIYAEDNGSGKTRLMALFPTGAAVQIAIEP